VGRLLQLASSSSGIAAAAAAHRAAGEQDFPRSLSFSFAHLLRRVDGEMHARYRCCIEGTRIASVDEEGVGDSEADAASGEARTEP
jgi:hypothetical protein